MPRENGKTRKTGKTRNTRRTKKTSKAKTPENAPIPPSVANVAARHTGRDSPEKHPAVMIEVQDKTLSPPDREFLTSAEVSRLLQVDTSSVNGWVRHGKLRAFKTPGGHNRFEARELRRFLESTGMHIPGALLKKTERRLLVVDDDKRELARWKRSMKRFQDQVALRCVDNGIEALVQVGAFRPHLVVLDYVMPGIDGIEVCRRLGQMTEISHTQVVLLSAAMSEELAEEALAAGACAAWSKPQPITGILTLLETVSVADHQ